MKKYGLLALAVISFSFFVGCASTDRSVRDNGMYLNDDGSIARGEVLPVTGSLSIEDVTSAPSVFAVNTESVTPVVSTEFTALTDRMNKTESMVKRNYHTIRGISKDVDKNAMAVRSHSRRISWLTKSLAEVKENWNHDKEDWYLWTTNFRMGSAKLSNAHKKGLDKLASLIKDGSLAVAPYVVGYASKVGGRKRNEELMMARATNSVNYIVEQLGSESEVPGTNGVLWKDYFISTMGEITDRYGSFKYNQRVRIKRTDGFTPVVAAQTP